MKYFAQNPADFRACHIVFCGFLKKFEIFSSNILQKNVKYDMMLLLIKLSLCSQLLTA